MSKAKSELTKEAVDGFASAYGAVKPYIPQSYHKRIEFAIKALLKKLPLLPLKVKRGDVVVIGKYSGSEVMIDDESVLFIREDDVKAILSRDSK